MARARFLPGVRRALGLVETKSLAGRVLSQPRMWTTPGQPYYNNWNVDRAVTEGYSFNPYIFRAVEVIASNAGARRVVLRREDAREGPVIPSDELTPAQRRMLRLFSRRANPWEVSATFRHRLYCQYLLSSRGVYIEVVRNRSGTLWGLLLLDPDRVEIVPTEVLDPATGRRLEANPIGNFRIIKGAEDGGFDYLPPYDPTTDPTEQPSGVLWLRSPHPTILTRGMSPMEAAGLSVDLDRYARLYNRNFMRNDGRPGGILAVKGQADDDTMERLRNRFGGGVDESGRTTVIQAEQISWQDTSNHPRDTQWGDTMDRMRRDATIAFGVPVSLLGDASGRTYDNADAEYATFWENPMVPLLNMIDSQLDALTPSGYDDEDYFSHDTGDVWVLGRHQREADDRLADDLDRGAVTLDDYLEGTRRERLDVPASRVRFLQPGRLVVGDGLPGHDQDVELVAALPMVGSAPAPDVGREARNGAQRGSLVGARMNANQVSALRADMLQTRALPAGAVETKQRPDREGEQSRARAGRG